MRRDAKIAEKVRDLVDEAITRLPTTASDSHNRLFHQRIWRRVEVIAQHAARDERWDLDGDVLRLAAAAYCDRGAHVGNDLDACLDAAEIAEADLRAASLDSLVWPVCSCMLSAVAPQQRPPSSREAQVLCDAIAIDSVSAAGVAAMLAGAAREHLYDALDPRAARRDADPQRFLTDRVKHRLDTVSARVSSRWARLEATRHVRATGAWLETLLNDIEIGA